VAELADTFGTRAVADWTGAYLRSVDGRVAAAAFEEEGVPVHITVVETGQADRLAARAAARSPLRIGFASDDKVAVIHLAGAASPYLSSPIAQLRHLAQQAARIAARRPLLCTERL